MYSSETLIGIVYVWSICEIFEPAKGPYHIIYWE